MTGSPAKLAEARRIVGPTLESIALDLPEIQSLDLREVAEAKAAEAFRRVGRPLVVEETGLELGALGGFPGPLVKWMLAAIGAEGIAHVGLRLGDSSARARCLVLWTDGERRFAGEATVTGDLVLPPRGVAGFGWDSVFQPRASNRTFAELGERIKDETGPRGLAWRSLLGQLAR